MSHIKFATMGMPRVKLPKVALPRISVGEHHHEYEKEEYKHAHSYARDREHMAAMSNVLDRMEEPPHTWASYHDKPGGMMSIVEMEYRELMEEKTEGSTSGIKKELTDLAAACIHALKKM